MNSQTTLEQNPSKTARAIKPGKSNANGQTRTTAAAKSAQPNSLTRPATSARPIQEPESRATRLLTTESARREIVFVFDNKAAHEVLLAGTFTNWNEAPIRMRRDGGGNWQTKVLLAPGRYRYKYLVDGVWHTDPQSSENCPNPYGTADSVKEIA